MFLGELRIQAITDNLRLISHFVHGIGHRLSLSDKMLFDLELAVEEAATNIINHAYPDDKGDLIVTAEQTGDFVQITLTDWGKPFDPSMVRPFDLNAPVETRIRGGMGLHFIHTLMDRVERETASRPGAPNTIRLIKHIERAAPDARPISAAQELNAIRTISEVITSNIELDDLLSLILNKLITTINAERGTIYLVDHERGELWSRVLLDELGPLSEIRLKLGEGIAGTVAATGETLNIPDVYADPRFQKDFDEASGFRTRSLLTAPMFNPQRQVIGVVQVLNKHGGPFTARDERLLAAMSSQAAISIENARLYEQELQQRLLNQELKTAHNIQASFLPDTIPQVAGWDLAALWYPIHSVAGDFYDLSPLDDGRLAIMIADVSGKGIPAALFMALSVTVLRFGIGFDLPPGEVLRRANELIIAEQRSRMFATVFLGYLGLDDGGLHFASGGHNPAIIYRAASGTCEAISASGVAIGIFRGADFEEATFHLEPGDILALYTDGISEALNDDEEEFGEERIQELIARHAARPAQELAQLVLEAVDEFCGQQHRIDDATLLIIRRTGSPPA
ncbi:MAG: SpoIIE family protein phosphatase [Chloroflexi bacterium]|nr:SpoIIE family protein phosphatase [Chloroflexota bacterium]